MRALNRNLPEWFTRIRTGQVRLPRFQRFEAWGPSEIVGILEAVLHGLPVGALLILEVGDSEKFVSRPISGVDNPQERCNEHLLDGQQRLTALWKSLNDLYDDRTHFVSLEPDEDKAYPIIGQARWQKNGTLYPVWADQPAALLERKLIPVSLLRPDSDFGSILNWCEQACGKDTANKNATMILIQSLRERVLQYNIPYLSLPVATPPAVALDVFIKMNSSSVALSAFDIVVAQFEAKTDQSLHALIGDLTTELPQIAGYGNVEDFVLASAALSENKIPNQSAFFTLDLARMLKEWSDLAEGLRWAVTCLEQESVFDAQRLPTIAVIPVLAALYRHLPRKPDARGNARILLRAYLWRAFFSRRYENAASSHSLQDYRGLLAALEGGTDNPAPIFDETLYPMPNADELVRAGWPKRRDILARGILTLSLRSGAHDLADGERVSRAHIKLREYHHLFPDALLTNLAGLGSSEIYRALNCALITWNTNRTISAKEPLRYLAERASRSDLGEAAIRQRLESHLVPYLALASAGEYRDISDPAERAESIKTDYRAFLSARADAMLEALQPLWRGMDA